MSVLVLILRWGMVLRNSNVCLFFCRGYLSSAEPITSTFEARISQDWFFPGDSTTVPSTLIQAPVDNSDLSTLSVSSITTWILSKQDPSLMERKYTFFEKRAVLIHPYRLHFVPIACFFKISEILSLFPFIMFCSFHPKLSLILSHSIPTSNRLLNMLYLKRLPVVFFSWW